MWIRRQSFGIFGPLTFLAGFCLVALFGAAPMAFPVLFPSRLDLLRGAVPGAACLLAAFPVFVLLVLLGSILEFVLLSGFCIMSAKSIENDN
jgi:hypothetical protein